MPARPAGRDELGVGTRIAGEHPVVRGAGVLDQLHAPKLRHAGERDQVPHLKGLQPHRRRGALVAVTGQRRHQRRLHGEPARGEVARVLGLGVDTDARRRGQAEERGAARALRLHRLHQGEDLLQRCDLELPVEARIRGPQLRDALAHAQALQFREREVLGEPAVRLGAIDAAARTAGGETRLLGDIGGGGDLVLVARHQHAVARHDQVRLDEVRTHLQRKEVGGEGVLGDVAAGAAMGDDDGQAAHGADTSTPPPVLLDFCACCSRNATSTTSAKAATSGPTRSSARMRHEGGTHFAVWAPNATAVHVIGDFNDWRHGEHALAVRADSSGIWEGVVPGVTRGALYKYQVLARDGTSEEKSDPYAFYAEAPPRTASVVWDLEYPWQDGPWCAQRARHNALERPLVDLRAAPGLLAAHPGGRQPARSATGRWRRRSPTTPASSASRTWSCCRSWSIRSSAPGVTRSPGTSRPPPATARRRTSCTSSTTCTAAASA